MPDILWKDDIAVENWKLYKENKVARQTWERDALRFDEFRYGMHFSKAEESELLAFRQAPLPISITTAICDTAEALMTASKPTIRVAPIIDPFDERKTQLSKIVAAKYQFLCQKSWFDSLGGLHYDRVVRDYTNVGVGYFYVVPRMEYGEFSVDVKHLSWRYVYPHKMTKDPFFQDMDNAVIAMTISKEAGYKYVRSITDISRKDYEEDFVKGNIGATHLPNIPTRYTSQSVKDTNVFFCTRLQLEEHKSYIIIPQKTDGNSFINESVVKIVPELTDDMREAARAGQIRIEEETDFFLTEYISVGNKGFKKIYPIRSYNLIPLIYDHRDSPYPFGRIWYLYPLQRALNKFIMVALLNGSLMNSLRILYEEGSITDTAEFDKNFAKMGARLAWKQTVPGITKEPIIIEPKPLGEAWLQMPKYITYIMEYISGIFGAMMGDSQNSPDVFSTVAALQSAGGQKIKRRLAQADATLSLVGERVAEYYREYAPFNGFSTLIDENGEQSEPQVYNRLRVKNGTDNELEVEPETDLSLGFKAVRFTTQASNGFESGTEAALLTNLATQLKVPELVPLILKRLNIPDVDKIMSQLDTVSKQNATIEQMGKTIQDLEGRTKVLANQVTQKAFETSKAQFDSKFKEILANIKAEAKINGEL